MERPSSDPLAVPPATVRPPDPVQRWRLTLRRRADAPAVAQRESQGTLEAALAASGLPLAMAEGPGAPARPRMAVAAPLTQGMAAERELVDLYLVRRLPIWQVREALADRLPPGYELVDLEDVWLGEPAVAGRVVGAEYESALDGAAEAALAGAVSALLRTASAPRRRVRGDRTVDYDLRPFIEALEVVRRDAGPILRMHLRHDPEKGVGRPEEVLAELAERARVPLDPSTLVRTRLVLAPLRRGPSPERPSSPRPHGARPAGARSPRRPA